MYEGEQQRGGPTCRQHRDETKGGLHKYRLIDGCLKDEDISWVGEGRAYGWVAQ